MAKDQAFVSNRDVIVRSAKYGRSYSFKKGEPRTDVIPQMHQELLNLGIMPVDGQGKPAVAEVTVEEPVATKKILFPPDDGDQRKSEIYEAIKLIVERNDPADFSGGGQPKAAAVTQITGWRCDSKDVGEVWKEHREEFARK